MSKRNDGRIGRLREELARAREKATEWQTRVRDLERRIAEQENTEILRTVRSVVASPEELRGLLEQIQTAGLLRSAQEAPPVDSGGEEGQEGC